ncbi:MAG: hypothetical protein WAR78_08560, partial [Ferruginibacter sp.]
VVLISGWWLLSAQFSSQTLFNRLRHSLMLIVLLQLVLGILTVMNATSSNLLVILGVSHQFIAMGLLMVLVSLIFIVRKKALAA